MIVLALLLALDLAGYRQELQGIDARLARGDSASAAAAARKLLDEKIDGGLSPDAWVLEPIADGTPHRPRLQRLLQTLEEQPEAMPAVDPALLERVRREQSAAGGAAGGELGDLPLREPTLLQSFLELLTNVLAWVADLIRQFFDWVSGLFPDAQPGPHAAAGSPRLLPVVLMVVGLVLVIVIALAVRAALRPEPLRAEAVSDKAASKKDDDPLSRTASGWEARAVGLAAEGRFREAIRAWYHALLVHAAGAGVLQYQRGRTNWEYVSLISPAIRWRPTFAELTRLFEREWYGRAESREEELQVFQRDARQILAALREAV